MKLLAVLPALAFSVATLCCAEEPSLSVYQVIPGDAGSPRGELVMKLNNPTRRAYSVLGMGINCLWPEFEVFKGGKWVAAPGQEKCITGSQLRPLLPGSYVVMSIYPPPSVSGYATFRVKLRLYRDSDILHPAAHPAKEGNIDLVSDPLGSKDLQPITTPPALSPIGEPRLAQRGDSGDPSLSIYEILREDPETGAFGELILKINNPPGKTYYILGAYMTDVPYVIEVEQNGKWVETAKLPSLSAPKMRPFLQDSYLLFGASPLPSSAEDIRFRVRAILYTEPAVARSTAEPSKRMEIVSRTMCSNEFAPLHASGPGTFQINPIPCAEAPRLQSVPGAR